MIYFSGNLISPCHATGLFLYPLKTSENQRFSDVFRGYRKRPVAWNWLKRIMIVISRIFMRATFLCLEELIKFFIARGTKNVVGPGVSEWVQHPHWQCNLVYGVWSVISFQKTRHGCGVSLRIYASIFLHIRFFSVTPFGIIKYPTGYLVS